MPKPNFENLDCLFDSVVVLRNKNAKKEAEKKSLRKGECESKVRRGNCEILDKGLLI